MHTSTQKGVIAGLVAVVIILVVWVSVAGHKKSPVPAGQFINTVSYTCDASKTVLASYYAGTAQPAVDDQPPVPGGSVVITLSDGRAMTLVQTISADGTRYANADESFVFWSKGTGALVLENGQQQSYANCTATQAAPATGTTNTGSTNTNNLSETYTNAAMKFSISLPRFVFATSTAKNTDVYSYTVDPAYHYQELGPGKDILGVKFTIPSSIATGTNLSSDSYLSVEEIPGATTCSAVLFVPPGTTVKDISENGKVYSTAVVNGAAAGNRYQETVYALPGTNPCVAVRYFIHTGLFQNYPTNTVAEFDPKALLAPFNQIRQSLVIKQ